MTDLRQAANQALEALEGELWLMLDKPEDEQYRVKYAYLLTVITALRTALEQPEQQAPFSPEAINTTQTAWRMGYEAAKAEQQAEPEQMPTMAQQIEDARHLERFKPRLKK